MSEKIKSNPPKNAETIMVIPSTIAVYLQTSLFESQLTLFISTKTSLKNSFIFCIIVIKYNPNLQIYPNASNTYLWHSDLIHIIRIKRVSRGS